CCISVVKILAASATKSQRWMAFAQHGNHVFFGDMSVALGGGNGGVSQEFLDNADVHAIAKQQRGHGMAQHVRSNVPFNSGLLTQLGDYVGNSLGCKSCSGGVEKESR